MTTLYEKKQNTCTVAINNRLSTLQPAKSQDAKKLKKTREKVTIKNSSTKHLCQTKIDRERDQSSSLKTSPISITKHLCHKC